MGARSTRVFGADTPPRRIIVLGAGAIGAPVGCLLAQQGVPVVLVARGAHGQALAHRGLDLRTPSGAAIYQVPVVAHVAAAAPTAEDLVLLTVMGQHTLDAMADVPAHVPVASLQNGTAPIEALASRGHPLIAGVVFVPAERRAPGVVALSGAPVPGAFILGDWPSAATSPWGAWLRLQLSSAGFRSQVVADIAPWVRAKLLGNLAGVVVALCDAPVPDVVEAAQAEARAVWSAAGQPFETPSSLEGMVGPMRIEAVDGLPRVGGSTRHALARGQALETPTLHGPVVRLGARVGVPTPVNNALIALAKRAHEQGWKAGNLSAGALRNAVGL